MSPQAKPDTDFDRWRFLRAIILLLHTAAWILGAVALSFGNDNGPGTYGANLSSPNILAVDPTPFWNGLQTAIYTNLSEVGVSQESIVLENTRAPVSVVYFSTTCQTYTLELEGYICNPNTLGQDFPFAQAFTDYGNAYEYGVLDAILLGPAKNGLYFALDNMSIPITTAQLAAGHDIYNTVQEQLTAFANNDLYTLHIQAATITLMMATVISFVAMLMLLVSRNSVPRRIRAPAQYVQLALLVVSTVLFFASAGLITAQINKIVTAPAPLPCAPNATLATATNTGFVAIMWLMPVFSLLVLASALLQFRQAARWENEPEPKKRPNIVYTNKPQQSA